MMNPIKHAPVDLSRRGFLIGTVGGGLLMGFGAVLPSGCAREELAAKNFAPTVWFELSSTGDILINIAKAEMGQHVGTALARIVADELGANWADVRINHVDSDSKWGYMVTGGSWSVFTSFTQLSQAGAAGRVTLIDAGAALLGVAADGCVARDSQVIAGDNSIAFAEIVQRGAIDRSFTADELGALPVKTPEQRDLIGKPTPQLDIPAKSTGQAEYGLDAELPGMVYARPVLPPTRYGCVVNSVDDAAATGIAGYLGYEVLSDPSETCQGWVVTYAESFVAASRAADALQVDWTAGPAVTVSEDDILAEGRALVARDDSGALLVNDGDVAQARNDAARVHEATYTTATALHFQLEPVNALAEFDGQTWHLHAGNQWQSLILPTLAKALEVAESQVVIHQYYLGGGFGRRLVGDYMVPAALLAKALGKPVKLVFTREDDTRFDCVRSPSVQRLRASFDGDKQLTGVEHAAAAGWPTLANAPGFMIDGLDDSGKIDTFSISGADHWYTLPNHRVRAINNPVAQGAFLPGWLRAVGPGWVGWAVESFMDELAAEAGVDPIEFRLNLLDAAGKNAGNAPESVGGAARLANVLRTVRDSSDWKDPLPVSEARGVAICHGQERTMPTWTGCVAHVAVDATSGEVTVKRLSLAIDCGTVVNPDGAQAQAESAALWGLSLALHENTRIVDGQVADRNLDTYTPLRMSSLPAIDVTFIDSTEFPVGMGEPPLIVVAPAIGNAVYRAIGARVRDLPIRPAQVREAMIST